MRSAELVYVDTSAYVKRFARERGSERFARRVEGLRVVSSILLWPEAMSAIARKAREGDLPAQRVEALRTDVAADMDRLLLVRPSRAVVDEAEQLLFAHVLRASDAVHLASAIRIGSGRDEPVAFLTADAHLAAAASEEELAVETFGV